MKFLRYIISFFAISLLSTMQAQQHVIPITHQTIVNAESIQSAQPINQKKTKFKKKFVRHSTFKKACVYGGCVLGSIAACFCLFTVGLPIIISTILITFEIVARTRGSLIRISY